MVDGSHEPCFSAQWQSLSSDRVRARTCRQASILASGAIISFKLPFYTGHLAWCDKDLFHRLSIENIAPPDIAPRPTLGMDDVSGSNIAPRNGRIRIRQ